LTTRVVVVGAGVVGLTAAIRLREAGHAVRVVAREVGEATTSAVAAALWYPYRALPHEAVTRWAGVGYRVLAGLAEVPGSGVAIRWGTEVFRDPPAGDPWWRAAVPVLERAAPASLPPGRAGGFRLPVPVADMAVHLPWLAARFAELGGEVERRAVGDLDAELRDADVVVDCAGLGARDLAGDPTVTPVRGQVAVLGQVGLAEWLLDQADPAALAYVVPRTRDIVCGGTAQEGAEDLAVDPGTAADVLARCRALVPALRDAPVLAHRVGLRPARPAVRLEAQDRPGGRIVHCYGHGGAGVTLSWGCAADVAALVG
jgi:D-amino-acid oxidase